MHIKNQEKWKKGKWLPSFAINIGRKDDFIGSG